MINVQRCEQNSVEDELSNTILYITVRYIYFKIFVLKISPQFLKEFSKFLEISIWDFGSHILDLLSDFLHIFRFWNVFFGISFEVFNILFFIVFEWNDPQYVSTFLIFWFCSHFFAFLYFWIYFDEKSEMFERF